MSFASIDTSDEVWDRILAVKPDHPNQTLNRCLVILFTLWTAAILCYLAFAKGIATWLVVLGLVFELVALLVLWFVIEEQKRDRE